MRELVFVHGRGQEGLPSLEEKRKWIGHLQDGLEKSGLDLPIEESDVHFPYYGDALQQLVAGVPREAAAKVIQRGYEEDENAQAFLADVLQDIQQELDFTPAQLQAGVEVPEPVIGRGLQNSAVVLSILRALDAHSGALSSAAIAIATYDVYQYLHNPGVRQDIDEGVLPAVRPGIETVVVAHSLGTVIAYRLLRDRGQDLGWNVPHFITLGSPLGIRTIRSAAGKVQRPAVVDAWSNAYDADDVVALRPLAKPWFTVAPPIENLVMRNPSNNRHDIKGYLGDPEVARLIYDALTG